MKNVQIRLDLFLDLCDFVSDYLNSDPRANLIDKQLSEKLDKIIDHEIFTMYKRAATPEEREHYRKQYLDRRGVSQSFRTPTENRNI